VSAGWYQDYSIVAQLRILGPVIYGVVGGHTVEVARIDPQTATRVLRELGYRDECAVLIAHHKLDTAAALRLGRRYGLIAAPEPIPLLAADTDGQAKADVMLVHLTEGVALTH
jgi:hypothetical protein